MHDAIMKPSRAEYAPPLPGRRTRQGKPRSRAGARRGRGQPGRPCAVGGALPGQMPVTLPTRPVRLPAPDVVSHSPVRRRGQPGPTAAGMVSVGQSRGAGAHADAGTTHPPDSGPTGQTARRDRGALLLLRCVYPSGGKQTGPHRRIGPRRLNDVVELIDGQAMPLDGSHFLVRGLLRQTVALVR